MSKRKYTPEENTSLKKLKKGISVEVDGILEQPKIDEGEESELQCTPRGFDVKHFRKELAHKQGQTMVLTQFLQVCLNPDNDVDYLLEYLKCGGNSHEILRQITLDSKKNLSLATPAVHIFHLIILKVQSSLPHMIAITEEACRYFLNTFMSTVEIMISESSGPRHRKLVLKLLTSMVTLNSDLGVEVLNQAPLTPKHLQHVVEKCNYKEKDNVRTCFVHFMTSFLVEGHLPLVKALLEKQGLLGLVIPGLINDDADAVLMFLSILKKNVVDNTFVSKSLKLKMFSQQVLHNMFKIFSWKGPPDISNENKIELRKEILSLLSEILVTLFTNHKIGLYFVDNTLGMTDANKNPNLYKTLLSLKRPWEHEVECDVVLQIIYKCPDLHRAIINILEQSFEPQHSPIWERSTTFVVKLMEKLKPEAMVSRLSNLSSTQIANFVRFITLPVPLLKFMQSSFGKDQTISLYCAKVLSKMLHTLKKYMQFIETCEFSTAISDLRNRLEYFLPKHMPAPGALVALIDKVIANTEKLETTKDYTLPKISDTDALISLINLLLLYNDIHPAFFESLEESIDMKKILDYSVALDDGKTALLKFKVVSLWLTLDSSAISLKNPIFKDLFLIMLDVYMSEDDSARVEATETLRIFFKNTAIFEADEDEIHLILYTLRNSKVEPPSLVGDIVVYILENIKDLSEYVKSQSVNFEIFDENNASLLEKLLDDLAENRNADDNVFLENKAPSPFIVGCMQYLQINKESKKNLKSFLSLYVVNLLHSNYSPELTEVLIGDFKLEARNYVASWSNTPAALPESITGSDSILMHISKSVTNDEDLSTTDIFPFLQTSSMDDKDIIVNETAYKLDLSRAIDNSELLIWAKYLIFCIVKLTDLAQLTPERQKKITDYFHCLITIGRIHHKVDICRTILLNLLKNPHVLKIFKPIDQNKSEADLLATKFLLQVISYHSNIISYLDNKHKVLKSFQQKIYNEIVKAFIKINKRKNVNSDHTMLVLETVGLMHENDLRVFSLVFSADVTSCVKDDKEPSLVLEILRYLVDKYSKSPTQDLQQQVLRKCMILYTNLLTSKEVNANLTKLETSLAQYFENKPHQVNKVSGDLFKKFFESNTIRKTTSHLAYVLLKNNAKFCNTFKTQIAKPEILSHRELTLPLGSAILNHKSFLLENKQLLTDIYNEYKSNISKLLEKPHKAGQVYLTNSNFVKKLVLECMDLEECGKVFSKSHKFEAVEAAHVHLFHSIFLKLCFSEIVTKEHLINYFLSMLHLTTVALKEGKEMQIVSEITTNIYRVAQISRTIEILNVGQTDEFKKVTTSALWQNFCRTVIKDSLKVKNAGEGATVGPRLLCLLTHLVKLLYPHEHEDISSLFDMVTSHSEFLNVMLSHHSSDIKCRLLEFLYTSVRMNGATMNTRQIPVYLSAYHATRSHCDRLILAILYHYEASGLPLDDHKPYVWGDSAASHYAVRRRGSSSLWARPTPNRVLNMFERDVVERTVRHFPVGQTLEYHFEPPSEFDRSSPGGVAEDGIYDPAFALAVLAQALAPGSGAGCARALRSGALALPLAALASACPRMRAAAALVLRRVRLLLDTDTRHKNDKLFLSDFIATVRRSVREAGGEGGAGGESGAGGQAVPRLAGPVALYLARAPAAATAPGDPLYRPVNDLLIAKRALEPTLVPDFLALFHDASAESDERRRWALALVRDGVRGAADADVAFRTMCLKPMLEYCGSALSSRGGRAAALDALRAAAREPRARRVLLRGHGLLGWLRALARRAAPADLPALLALVADLRAPADRKLDLDAEDELAAVLSDAFGSSDDPGEELALSYLRVYNAMSKKTIRNLPRDRVLRTVAAIGRATDCRDGLAMLTRAVAAPDPDIMRSELIEAERERNALFEELVLFVRAYLM